MRVGNFFGKRVVLSNKQWEACLRRLDIRGAAAGSEKWFIHAKCPFCSVDNRFRGQCEVCPLGIFKHSDSYGCLILVNRVGREDCGLRLRATAFLDFADASISWYLSSDKKARIVLQALYVRFKKMRKTFRR